MTPFIYVIHKCAISLDGFLDDTSSQRLVLSPTEDLDRLDEVRAQCDAIMVGAETVRRDNPSLLVRSEERRRQRLARGQTEQPLKVTLTRSGRFDPKSRFFCDGRTPKIVYGTTSVAAALRQLLGAAAEAVPLGKDDVVLSELLSDLAQRGVKKLLLEGGSALATQFHVSDLVDELQLSIAPLFVGEAAAPRFVHPARFARDPENALRLVKMEQLGDIALLTYRRLTSAKQHSPTR